MEELLGLQEEVGLILKESSDTISEKISNRISEEHRKMLAAVNRDMTEKMDALRNKTAAQINGVRKTQDEKSDLQKMFDIIIVVLLIANIAIQFLSIG